MRDSNSNNGYTVLYGLGFREARIAAGELEGVVEACAEPSTAMRMNAAMDMISEILRFGGLFLVAEWLSGFF